MSDSVFGEKNKIINFFKEQLLLRRLEAEIREVSSADLQSGRDVSLLCPDPLQFLSPCRESVTILILLQPGDITAPLTPLLLCAHSTEHIYHRKGNK